MPTLDDAPTIAPLTSATLSTSDLIQVYDVSAQRPKTVTIANLITFLIANGIDATD